MCRAKSAAVRPGSRGFGRDPGRFAAAFAAALCHATVTASAGRGKVEGDRKIPAAIAFVSADRPM